MTISARSVLMAGIAAVTASVVAIAPSVQPLPPPRPTIQLAARDAQLLALQEQSASPHRRAQLTASAARARSTIRNVAPSTGSSCDIRSRRISPTRSTASMIAVEPWVQYGFEVATAVIRLDPLCRLVRRSRSWPRLLLRRAAWWPAASLTSPIGFAATVASSRTSSTSASTSAWHSSGWDSTR